MNPQRTFLKVFVDVPETPAEEKSDDGGSYSSSGPISGSKSTPTALSRSQTTPSALLSSSQSAQYCTISIRTNSTALEVCNAVARKRNLLFNEEDYELVMCDGDGQASYETILGPDDEPHQFQQSAAKHGHLGDFHFVFRAITEEDSASDADDADSDADSDADMFPATSHVKMVVR